MYKTSKYYSYIFYADRNLRPCTILGYTLTTFPKSRKTLMHNQSNRNLWHNCKRNKKQTKTKTPPNCEQKDLANTLLKLIIDVINPQFIVFKLNISTFPFTVFTLSLTFAIVSVPLNAKFSII